MMEIFIDWNAWLEWELIQKRLIMMADHLWYDFLLAKLLFNILWQRSLVLIKILNCCTHSQQKLECRLIVNLNKNKYSLCSQWIWNFVYNCCECVYYTGLSMKLRNRVDLCTNSCKTDSNVYLVLLLLIAAQRFQHQWNWSRNSYKAD